MSLPELELSQLAGSSDGEGVERQEEQDELSLPAAAAAVPLASAPDTADRSDPELSLLDSESPTGESQEVEGGILEADIILVPLTNNWCGRMFIVPNPMAMRYVYAALFALMTIVAWIMRDIELSRFDHGCDGSHDCIAANGVLRASMALDVSFIFEF